VTSLIKKENPVLARGREPRNATLTRGRGNSLLFFRGEGDELPNQGENRSSPLRTTGQEGFFLSEKNGIAKGRNLPRIRGVVRRKSRSASRDTSGGQKKHAGTVKRNLILSTREGSVQGLIHRKGKANSIFFPKKGRKGEGGGVVSET